MVDAMADAMDPEVQVARPGSTYQGQLIEAQTGRSLVPVLGNPAVWVRRDDESLGYELAGNKALFKGALKRVLKHPRSDVIEGLPGGRFASYAKVRHARLDAVSGARLVADGLSRSAAAQKPPLWAQTFGNRAARLGGTMVDRLVKPAVEAAGATGGKLPGAGRSPVLAAAKTRRRTTPA